MRFNIYGLLVGIGIVIVINTLDKYTSKQKFHLKITDYAILLLSALIGARGIYMLHNLTEISEGTITWWIVSDGGLSIYGALIGVLISTLIISKLRTIPFFVLTDGIVKNLPLAQSIGRFGNYFNRELYGRPSTLPWSIYIPIEKRLEGYTQYSTFHPAFLYESVLNFFNWLILNKILRLKNYRNGTITGVYLINYGIIRLIMNTIRIDKEYLMGIETSDLASVLAVSIGILILILISPEKVKNSIAKIFSNIFNGYITLILPLLYTVISLDIYPVPKILISLITALSPISIFLILKKMKKVSDFDMTDRKERPVYCVTTTIVFLAIYLTTLKLGSTTLSTIALNTLLTSGIFTIITFFWKISGHMTYLTMAYCSFIYLIPSPYVVLLFSVIPFVAWSRVELKKHNVPQVIAGILLASLISVLVFALV